MEILKYPHPWLHLYASVIPSSEELPQLVSEMKDIMLRHNGIGLAATQVGLDRRLFIMKMPDKDKLWVVVNPVITSVGTRLRVIEEGCLSLPGLLANVARPSRILVEFQDENGKIIKTALEGITGRCYQHEIDHLNGVLFIDRIIPEERDVLLAKYNRIAEGGDGVLG